MGSAAPWAWSSLLSLPPEIKGGHALQGHGQKPFPEVWLAGVVARRAGEPVGVSAALSRNGSNQTLKRRGKDGLCRRVWALSGRSVTEFSVRPCLAGACFRSWSGAACCLETFLRAAGARRQQSRRQAAWASFPKRRRRLLLCAGLCFCLLAGRSSSGAWQSNRVVRPGAGRSPWWRSGQSGEREPRE